MNWHFNEYDREENLPFEQGSGVDIVRVTPPGR
jgi:hypothetical protein